jgi:phosphatidylglycerol:prolipoprotein diacylglycerol transferase
VRPEIVARLERAGVAWAGYLVPNYVVMLAAGSLLAAAVVVEEARRRGYRRRDTLLVLMVGYAVCLLGGALVPVGQGLAALARTGHFHVPTGMAAYGGLIGGTVAGVVALRRLGRPVRPFLDATAPAVGVGYFFARVGCFLAGCDYGVPSGVAWAVRFPRGSYAFRDQVARGLVDPAAPASLPVHPTQLYLAFVGLFLFLGLRLVPFRGDGRRFALLVAGYAVLRSTVELWRGDASRGSVGPFSTSQLLAFLTVLAAAVAWWLLRRRSLLPSPGTGDLPGGRA